MRPRLHRLPCSPRWAACLVAIASCGGARASGPAVPPSATASADAPRPGVRPGAADATEGVRPPDRDEPPRASWRTFKEEGREAARDPFEPFAGIVEAACADRDARVELVDANGDGAVDTWKLYERSADGGERLRCKRVDLSQDGRPNFYEGYTPAGKVEFEAFDLDFDRVVDTLRWRQYGRSVTATDTDGDGVPNQVAYREGGELMLLAIDRNGDGRPDVWKHQEEGRLVRTEYDDDHDGKVDRVQRP